MTPTDLKCPWCPATLTPRATPPGLDYAPRASCPSVSCPTGGAVMPVEAWRLALAWRAGEGRPPEVEKLLELLVSGEGDIEIPDWIDTTPVGKCIARIVSTDGAADFGRSVVLALVALAAELHAVKRTATHNPKE